MTKNTVSFKTICRGSGKIFISLSVTGLHANETLVVFVKSSKGNVPAMLFLDDKAPSSSTQGHTSIDSYVLVLPQLGLKQTIELFKTDSRKNETLICRKSLSELETKIASRLAYRNHIAEARRIRDYDRGRNIDNIHFEIWDCTPNGNSDITRGIVRMASTVTGPIRLSCFSETMERISDNSFMLSDTIVKTTEGSSFSLREIQYSMPVRRAGKCHIFQAFDGNGNALSGFESYDQAQYAKIVKSGDLFSRNAQTDDAYHQWFLDHRCPDWQLQAQKDAKFKIMPTFSIVVPLYKTPLKFFQDMLASVQQQSYSNWELILVNASPEDKQLINAVQTAMSADNRITGITLEGNRGITLNTNEGIETATGDFVSFFDHDDLLEPDILYEYVKALNAHPDTDLLYCDEDKLLADGHYVQPFFKPDFSIDLLRNCNYICHLLTVRRSVLDALPPATSEYDGAQDHNLTLKVAEVARRITHVPHVLYHWRMSETSTAASADNKDYATAAGIKAVQDHLERLHIDAKVKQSRRPFTYKIDYCVAGNPKVSVVIPTKDAVGMLDACLTSIFEKTTYSNYEIILVENNSTEADTFEYYRQIISTHENVRVERWPAEFNYSKINNFGVERAEGDYLILLNNDTEVITPNWIERMLGICQREDVGIVGVRLYYPDNTIQHAGVCVTGCAAGHLNRYLPKDNWGYFALADAEQNFSAVTAACLMTKRSIYEQVGGFTEKLAVTFNDVDFCLKVRETGRLVVYTPEVELYHYESISRGAENTAEKKARFNREVAYMNYRWIDFYTQGDPYINPNFDPDEPYNQYYRLMRSNRLADH